MKITATIVRIILGLLFLVSVVGFVFNLMPEGKMSDESQTFITGVMATRYLFPLIKGLELLCAVALLTNRFSALASVVIFPITVNIVLFHAFLAPENMVIPVALLAGNLFLAYYYRKAYVGMLQAV